MDPDEEQCLKELKASIDSKCAAAEKRLQDEICGDDKSGWMQDKVQLAFDDLDATFTLAKTRMLFMTCEKESARCSSLANTTAAMPLSQEEYDTMKQNLCTLEDSVREQVDELTADLVEFHRATVQQWTEEKKALLTAWHKKVSHDRKELLRGYDKLQENTPKTLGRAAQGGSNMDKSERLRQVAMRQELIYRRFEQMKITFEEQIDELQSETLVEV